jgi:hypothetical protein
MSTHTPGPWTVTHDKKHGQQRISANDVPIAVTKVDTNARLIAAAPELLKALKALVEPLSLDDVRIEDWQNARAAIAKAEGTS